MDDVETGLVQLRSSTATLLEWLAGRTWSDADAQAPSLLPGWTRGHVLTHLARNADGIAGTLAGALRGELVPQYPDGRQSRNDAIEAGSGRPVGDLIRDVEESAQRLDRVLGGLAHAHAWDHPADGGLSAGEWLPKRWREVEIHRVDLAADYGPEDWPPEFVDYLLTVLVTTLDERATEPVRVEVSDSGVAFSTGVGDPTTVIAPGWAVAAWLVGRPEVAGAMSGAPALNPWI